jgi:hypothetical protein
MVKSVLASMIRPARIFSRISAGEIVPKGCLPGGIHRGMNERIYANLTKREEESGKKKGALGAPFRTASKRKKRII